jgi:hypothetical protein
LKSKSRFIVSLVASVLIVVFSFYFVPRDVTILASRPPIRQVLDYILNFVVFFVAIYLLLSLVSFIINKVSRRPK